MLQRLVPRPPGSTTLVDVVRTVAQPAAVSEKNLPFSSVARELRGVCREMRGIADLLVPSLMLCPVIGGDGSDAAGVKWHPAPADGLEILTQKMVAVATKFKGLRKLSIIAPYYQSNANVSLDMSLMSRAVANLRKTAGRHVELPVKTLCLTDGMFSRNDGGLQQSLVLAATIADHMPHLTTLNLTFVHDLAPGFFELIGAGCPHLKRLKMEFFSLQPMTEVRHVVEKTLNLF